MLTLFHLRNYPIFYSFISIFTTILLFFLQSVLTVIGGFSFCSPVRRTSLNSQPYKQCTTYHISFPIYSFFSYLVSFLNFPFLISLTLHTFIFVHPSLPSVAFSRWLAQSGEPGNQSDFSPVRRKVAVTHQPSEACGQPTICQPRAASSRRPAGQDDSQTGYSKTNSTNDSAYRNTLSVSFAH